MASVAATDNQRVHAGDVLIRIDDREYRAQLAKATAVVSEQEATLANLDLTRHLQEAMVDQARADLAAAEAEDIRAARDADRYQHLVVGGAASAQSAQQAGTDYKKAFAMQWRARAAVDAAERRLTAIDAQKDQAYAAVSAARAERDLAVLNLDCTEIRAPIDGVVGNRVARLGSWTCRSGLRSSLSSLTRDSRVDANFKESQLARMGPGQHATLVADAFPDAVFSGTVESIAPATDAQFALLPPENATGNFTKIVQRVPVRIRLEGDNTGERLKPGLSVVVEIDVRKGGGPAGRE